jgi:hypothetical protein
MGEVYLLSERPVDMGQPNEYVIAMLTDMLEKARTGELQTILGCGRTSDGGMISMFTVAAKQDFYLHLGALEALKLEFVKRTEID